MDRLDLALDPGLTVGEGATVAEGPEGQVLPPVVPFLGGSPLPVGEGMGVRVPATDGGPAAGKGRRDPQASLWEGAGPDPAATARPDPAGDPAAGGRRKAKAEAGLAAPVERIASGAPRGPARGGTAPNPADRATAPIVDLRVGDRVEGAFLLRQIELKAARNGTQFLAFDLMDRSGTIPGRRFDADTALYERLQRAEVVEVKGRVDAYRGTLQVVVEEVVPAEPGLYSARDFLPWTPCEPAELDRKLLAHLAAVRNPHLAALVNSFLADEEFMARFRETPAAQTHHHAYLGGLLEHVVSLLGLVSRIADCYPRLDRDLLIVGAFLHDIGKVDELSWETGIEYTDEGKLLGHVVLGVDMVRERVRELPGFPTSLLNLVLHLILSHHGEYEFGAPRLPVTAEAVVLHHADNLDAKLASFFHAVDGAAEGAAWTDYVKSFGRSLFRGEAPDRAGEPR